MAINMKNIAELIEKMGIKVNNFDYTIYNSYITGAYQLYKGDVPSYHKKQFNGKFYVTEDKAQLRMAKRSCEDFASLVCNENMNIDVEGNAEREFLLGNDDMQGILGQNDFWAQFNKAYELTASLGTGAIEVVAENLLAVENKLVVGPRSKIKIHRYDALHILPLSWDNTGKILEVCFIDELTIKKENFLDLRIHILNEKGNYVIINKRVKTIDTSNVKTLNVLNLISDDGLVEELDTGSSVPWFSCLKMAQINSYDINGPMGASIYGDASDELIAIDDAFNTLCTEFQRSMKKVFYDKALLDKDKQGHPIVPDEANRGVFYLTGNDKVPGEGGVKELISEWNPKIRSHEINEGMELILDIFSMKVGLGHGYYKFSNGTVEKTKAEVLSENSDLYRNICKAQLAIEANVFEIVKAVLYVSNYLFGTSFNIDCNVSIEFDASIIEDKNGERERALKEVQLGLLTVEEYRAKYYPELVDKIERA